MQKGRAGGASPASKHKPIPLWIRQQECLTNHMHQLHGVQVKILTLIIHKNKFSDADRRFAVSYLAAKTGTPRSTVQFHLTKLIAAGWVRVVGKGAKGIRLLDFQMPSATPNAAPAPDAPGSDSVQEAAGTVQDSEATVQDHGTAQYHDPGQVPYPTPRTKPVRTGATHQDLESIRATLEPSLSVAELEAFDAARKSVRLGTLWIERMESSLAEKLRQLYPRISFPAGPDPAQAEARNSSGPDENADMLNRIAMATCLQLQNSSLFGVLQAGMAFDGDCIRLGQSIPPNAGPHIAKLAEQYGCSVEFAAAGPGLDSTESMRELAHAG